MVDINKIVREPIFFERNRVRRVYTGGKLFKDFFGDDSEDGYLPEEWIASATCARNHNGAAKEGVSVVKDTGIYFDELLANNKQALLGDRKELGILVKMLDSAIRLPVQAHPDKSFSRKHFNSGYGKAEGWVVIGVREGAKIYFGFSEKVSPKQFNEAIEASKVKDDRFSAFLNEVAVKPGDCFFIPARMIHAIGPGCLILEVQEPSDFTISPEHFCGEYEQSHEGMYLGLDKDTALSVFDFNACGEEVMRANSLRPVIIEEKQGVKYEKIIDKHMTDCFALNKITISGGEGKLNAAPAVYVVTYGNGELIGEGYSKSLRKGSYFFLPACANNFAVKSQAIVLYECIPPGGSRHV